MSSRAKSLIKLAMTRSSESDHDEFNGGGCVVEFPFIPETKLNAVRKESSALNVVEEQEDYQTKPVEKMSGQHILCIESDQLLQSIVMDEENNLNLPNIGPQNNDTTILKLIEKKSIEPEEITNENKRLKTTSTLFREHGEPMLDDELDQEPDQSVVEVERNNNLNNVGPHDSDLTDCEDSGGELDQDLDQPVVEVEKNNNLDNVGPHDSDLTDCEDLGGELDQELDQLDLNTNNKRSRKRKRQPEKWQKNVKKSLKNTGKSYQTLKGRTIPAKKLKTPCSTNCRLKCTEKINEEKRLNIFNDFWGIGDLERQRYFVANCLGVVKPKYSLHKEDSKRSLNVSYNFTINSEKIRVCKRFFTSTLDIGHSFLSTVNKKKAEATGVISEDLRGRHGNIGRCLAQADKDGARGHINSYPRKESHYCRASSTKDYHQ